MIPGRAILMRRSIVAMLIATVIGLCGNFFVSNNDRSSFVDPKGIDLAGKWEFRNGAIAQGGVGISRAAFDTIVDVPKPLPPEIKKSLKNEFWYRKKLPSALPDFGAESVSISLGSIKGNFELYWNEKYLGGGNENGLAIFRVPNAWVRDSQVELAVRVFRSENIFPGIVHMSKMAIGRSEILERQFWNFHFQKNVKSLITGAFKLVLFFVFAFLFLATPARQEYLAFSVFALLSSTATSLSSRLVPFFDQNFSRPVAMWIFSTLAFSMIPWLTADFLRFSAERRSWLRAYGFSVGVVFFGAYFLMHDREAQSSLFSLTNSWLPWLISFPSAVIAFLAIRKLEPWAFHRRWQIGIFGASLILGGIAWSQGTLGLFRFERSVYHELMDLMIYVGLASAMVLDVKVSIRRSDRAGKVVPKWFAGYLASGEEHVVFELPMIAMAVDTVAYTKKLALLDTADKSFLHDRIRQLMAPLTEQFGAQKLSDRGDGALFGWDLQGDSEKAGLTISQVLAGAEALLNREGEPRFRIGLAFGSVRCEMRGSELSFLGEPLNAASRLESLAQPGTALVHESLASRLNAKVLEQDWVEADVKGVVYRARSLALPRVA